jgi:hypothetical protein
MQTARNFIGPAVWANVNGRQHSAKSFKIQSRSHHATTCYGKFMRRHITKTLPETFELIQRKSKAVVLSHFGVNAALGEPFGQAQLSPRHAQIVQTGVHNVHGDTKVTSSHPFLEA